MTEATWVLEKIREAVTALPDPQQLAVLACAEEIRLVVARYNDGACEYGAVALALVGAEVSAEANA